MEARLQRSAQGNLTTATRGPWYFQSAWPQRARWPECGSHWRAPRGIMYSTASRSVTSGFRPGNMIGSENR
jgi:hypothetical protein